MEEKKILKKKKKENLVSDHLPKPFKIVSVEKVSAPAPPAFSQFLKHCAASDYRL